MASALRQTVLSSAKRKSVMASTSGNRRAP
jgi:hypothetical protein